MFLNALFGPCSEIKQKQVSVSKKKLIAYLRKKIQRIGKEPGLTECPAWYYYSKCTLYSLNSQFYLYLSSYKRMSVSKLRLSLQRSFFFF